MKNEKPGGHGERSVAVGVLDMALWDAVSKAEGVPLWRLLADRYNDGKADKTAWVYAAGGYYYPRQGHRGAAGRDEALSRPRLFHREDEDRRRAARTTTSSASRRRCKMVGGKGENLCVDVNGRYDLDEALACGDAIAPYGLRWYEEPLDPLDYLLHAALATRYRAAARHRREPVLDAGRAQPDPPRRPARRPRLAAIRSGAVLRARRISAHARHAGARTAGRARRCVPHGGHQFALNIAVGLGLGGNESYPQVFAPFGGFADNTRGHDSRIAMPDIPGIGFEAKNALYAVMKPIRGGRKGACNVSSRARRLPFGGRRSNAPRPSCRRRGRRPAAARAAPPPGAARPPSRS